MAEPSEEKPYYDPRYPGFYIVKCMCGSEHICDTEKDIELFDIYDGQGGTPLDVDRVYQCPDNPNSYKHRWGVCSLMPGVTWRQI